MDMNFEKKITNPRDVIILTPSSIVTLDFNNPKTWSLTLNQTTTINISGTYYNDDIVFIRVTGEQLLKFVQTGFTFEGAFIRTLDGVLMNYIGGKMNNIAIRCIDAANKLFEVVCNPVNVNYETDPVFTAWKLAAKLTSLQIGDDVNYVSIDNTGIKFIGETTVYEDQNIDPTTLTGGGNAPSRINISGTTIPIAAFSGAQTDDVASAFEYPHKAMLNAVGNNTITAEFHFHYLQVTNDSGNAYFELEYIWTKRKVPLVPAVKLYLTVPILANEAWLPNTAAFPVIIVPDTIGAQFHFKFSRFGGDVLDTYNGELAISTLGFHYKADAIGSDEKNSK